VHWVALHFPQLRRQALARGHAPPERRRESRERGRESRERGRESCEPERQALEAVAGWACQFTPRVSLEPPQALLLEVAGSLRYFGGRWKFLARLRAGLGRLGLSARIGEAPAARAALWLARGDGGRLEAQPVAVADPDPPSQALLANLGVKTIGGLLRLPREGIAQRFGERLLEQLDQACGRKVEAREFFVPPARFAARLELPAPVLQAESALFAARRLLVQMEGFLAARQAGVRAFSLALLHEDAPATELKVGLAAPGRAAEHFARLLRERLGALVLRSPIEAIRIEAGDIEDLLQPSRSLFDDRSGSEEGWLRLVERLQARLGTGAVHGLDTQEDHRPERAFCKVAFEIKDLSSKRQKRDMQNESNGPRPLWLLDPPRRLAEGEFALLAGPERIESGWWDGAEARRDYFIARTGEASLAWIYRESEGGWFLHGYFA
jgi:protein ImuB